MLVTDFYTYPDTVGESQGAGSFIPYTAFSKYSFFEHRKLGKPRAERSALRIEIGSPTVSIPNIPQLQPFHPMLVGA
jgi:hypothetical protein